MKSARSMSGMQSVGSRARRPRKTPFKQPSFEVMDDQPNMEGYTISGTGKVVQVSGPNGSYDVDVANRTCTCEAGKYERECKHIRFVDWWNEQGG